VHNLYKMAASPPEVSTSTKKPGISLAAPGYLFLGPRLGNSLLQGDWLDTELDEFEVYGRQETAAHRITAYSLEVCDSLPNFGPCSRVAMGESAFLSKETQEAVQRGGGRPPHHGLRQVRRNGDNQAGKSQSPSPSQLRTAISIMLSLSQSHLVYTPAVSHLA
jgi:hypothetical protein